MNQKHIVVTIILLLALAGTASAGDYYVSVTGDNGASGDLTHPWQNVSYATQQATPGDTIHLFDGTWYNEVCTFANSGTSGNRITLTAHNGTPTMRGDAGATAMIGIEFYSYTTISHITMANYTHCMFAMLGSSYSLVHDCDLGWTGGTEYGYTIKIAGDDSYYNTIENCTIHDSGWNSIQIYGRREGETPNNPSTHVTVRNCTVYNSNVHNCIDLFGNLQYVTIEDCEFYDNTQSAIFTHDDPDHQEYIMIRNNYFHDTSHGVNQFDNNENITIENNTFRNIADPGYPIFVKDCNNVTATNNTFINCGLQLRANNVADILCDINYFYENASYYRASYGGVMTVRNPLGKKVISATDGSTAFLEYLDGTVFTATPSGTGHVWTPIRYYPDRSNCSIYDASGGSWITPITSYAATLDPANAYLEDVTCSHESDTADDRTNISADSSVSNNPTTITATMQNSSNTYKVYVDGGYVASVVSNAAGVATYQYSSGWSTAHTFEFDWFSDTGFAGAPDPTNLQSTKSSTWVNHTWDAGSGNITNSYNVSKNSVWSNGSATEYWHQTGMSPGTWSSIIVWAYNNTGGISQNSISQNIQTDAAGWSPSIFGNYYNTSNPILITTKGYGDFSNLFNRIPIESDGNATSGRLGVTI